MCLTLQFLVWAGGAQGQLRVVSANLRGAYARSDVVCYGGPESTAIASPDEEDG